MCSCLSNTPALKIILNYHPYLKKVGIYLLPWKTNWQHVPSHHPPQTPSSLSLSSLPKASFLEINMHHLFRPLFRKTGIFGRRPTWLSKELLNEPKCKAHKKWKQGQTAKEKYKSTAQTCWYKTRKTKAQLELKLERNIKANKMWFYRHDRSEKKLRENLHPFLNGRKSGDGQYRKGWSTQCLFVSGKTCLQVSARTSAIWERGK